MFTVVLLAAEFFWIGQGDVSDSVSRGSQPLLQFDREQRCWYLFTATTSTSEADRPEGPRIGFYLSRNSILEVWFRESTRMVVRSR